MSTGPIRFVPPNEIRVNLDHETPNDKFRRLAQKRVQYVLDACDQLEHLSAAKYEYSEQEATCVVQALRGKVEEVERKLFGKKPEKKLFSFD